MKSHYLIIAIIFVNSFVSFAFANDFHINRLTKKSQRDLITSGLWQPGCPVDPTDIRLISVSYYDLLGRVHHDGKLLIHKSAAKNTLAVFKKFYFKKFPFSSIETLVSYQSNIQLAEEKNVTYGFACRRDIKNNFTQESWGTVLTINPTFNPEIKYINNKVNQYVEISPETGIFSINRSLKLKGMSEPVYSILSKNHFVRLALGENKIGWKKFIFLKNSYKMKTPRITASIINNKLHTSVPTFTYGPLTSEIKKDMKKSGTWFDGCPVSLDRLSLLRLSYYGFDNQVHTGTLIVFDAIAPYTVAAFKKLYKNHYLLEKFDVSHQSSANETENTSGFNCRNIVGKKSYSLHSYGLAIDMNVSRNPYIGAYKKTNNDKMIGTIVPSYPSTLHYLNRNIKRPGMNEIIVKTLATYGFIEWGGNWQDTTDYMHFQVPTAIAMHLKLLDRKTGEQLIGLIIKYPENAKHISSDTRWDYLYQMYPNRYSKVLKKYFPLLKTKDESVVIHLIYNELALRSTTYG
jgi:hypothetical protein